MTPEQIATARKIIAEHLGFEDVADITDEKHLFDDLGADSLDSVELAMAFEAEFGIEIGSDGWEDNEALLTVGAVIEVLKGKLP